MILGGMPQTLMSSQLGTALALAPIAIGVMWWLGVWRTRRNFCYAVIAYALTSSLGEDAIDRFAHSSHKLLFRAIWSLGWALVFVFGVSRATDKQPP